MKLFRLPETDYSDFYDIARFNLAWKINAFLTVSLLSISIYFSFHNTITFSQYFTGFILSATCKLS